MTEIFVEPELQELENAEQAQEWFEVATELGLDKQLKTADKSEEKKAPPYMYIDPKTSHIIRTCLLYTSPSPRDRTRSRMPSSA